MFTDKKLTSTYLGKEISKIRAGDILVIDIAMIPTLEEQSFVVADVMKNIDQLYSIRHNLDDVSFSDSAVNWYGRVLLINESNRQTTS